MMEFARVGILFGKLCIFTKLTKKPRFEESRGEGEEMRGGEEGGRRRADEG